MCLAVPGRVESIRAEQGTLMGRVSFGGVVKDVCLAYVPDIAVGDYALVHVGFALGRLDEAAARETLRSFAALGLLDGEFSSADAAEPADGANHEAVAARATDAACGIFSPRIPAADERAG